ncbi:hypothetical protein GCM10023322_37670 [Rugosimonospora acidiphila]|uniref:Uncharacterized protein n=1 Tax=Rugosimonospora acidiphila TaxID=556531 RepID=A0ABP9RWY5_9ACTN
MCQIFVGPGTAGGPVRTASAMVCVAPDLRELPTPPGADLENRQCAPGPAGIRASPTGARRLLVAGREWVPRAREHRFG